MKRPKKLYLAKKGDRFKKSGTALEKDMRPDIARKQGYDPEMLYVECGRCGAPVLWDEGRATKLLKEAGIDPMELDSSCLLVTDGCPACGNRDEYGVRIFRIGGEGAMAPGHA